MREFTDEDTFQKLRRCDYNLACAIYTIACFDLPIHSRREETRKVANPALKPVGWTVDTLMDESDRRTQDGDD